METKTMLDTISTAIERVVKGLQAAPTTTRMALGAFVTHALGQIRQAAGEQPEVAARRLAALKRAVDGARATLAKLNPEDTESEKIDVEVLTAWAPSKAEGDQPMEGLTTAEDQSTRELSPVAVQPALGSSAFAQNLDEVAKALERLKGELATARAATGERTDTRKAAEAPWPLDLNTESFRTAVAKAEAPPVWGFDPESVVKA